MTDTQSSTEIHQDAFVIDCHNDMPVELFMRQFELGDLGDPAGFYDTWREEFLAGGVDLQVLPVFVERAIPEAGLRTTLLTLARLRRAILGRPDAYRLCLDRGDLDDLPGAQRIGLLLALEGCAQIGHDVELFEPLHALGVRMASFTHFGRNVLADGSADEAVAGRLPSLGVEALGEL